MERINAYTTFREYMLYKDMLKKVNQAIIAAEEEENKAYDAVKLIENKPFDEFTAEDDAVYGIYEDLVERTHDLREKYDAIEHIIDLLNSLTGELEYLEECC